ncbi:MAG: hypothetical protein ABI401_03075 [Candidatus Dormibacter sp.]
MFRLVRLAALKDASYAFSSTYDGEVGASEERWRNGLIDRVRFVAEVDGVVVGTVLLCHRHHWMVHEGHWQLVKSDDGKILAIPPTVTFGPRRGDPTSR